MKRYLYTLLLITGLIAVGAQAIASQPVPSKSPAYFNNMTDTEFQDLSADQQQQIACQFFEVAPKKAEDLYYSISPLSTGSNMPFPMCWKKTIVDRVPEMQSMFNVLRIINYGSVPHYNCMYNDFASGQVYNMLRSFLLILAADDPYPNIQDGTFLNSNDYINYSPDIKHWAQQGNWERRQYAALQNIVAQVEPKLQAYYIKTFHVNKQQAIKAAQYYIDRFIWSYSAYVDASTTPLYFSACFETSDLDMYLKTGQLPAKHCAYDDASQTSPAITLRRLLGLAIVNGYPTGVVQKLIDAGAALNVNINIDYTNFSATDTPLMLAAARPDVIALLLKAGANPNSQNWFGKTALMYAIQEHDSEGIDLLIHAGADINQTTSPEVSRMGDGSPFEPISCSSILAGNRTALMYAAWEGTPDIIKQLIAAHANIDAKDTQGQTAYDYLAKNTTLSSGERSAMEVLLKPVSSNNH